MSESGGYDFEHYVTHTVGENAGLRRIDEHDPVDLAHMWEIEKSEGMSWLVGKTAASKSEVARFVRKLNGAADNSGAYHLFGVTAEETNHQEHTAGARGEVEGWLRADETRQELDRYQRIMGCTLPKDTPPPIELAYIRRPNGPPGLMAGAVRQFCLQTLKEDSMKDGAVEETVDPAGKKDAVIHPKRPIMLFVEKANVNSIKMATAAGFDLAKENVSWSVKDEPDVDMYLLNWDRLQQVQEQHAQTAVLDRMSKWFQGEGKPHVITDRTPPAILPLANRSVQPVSSLRKST